MHAARAHLATIVLTKQQIIWLMNARRAITALLEPKNRTNSNVLPELLMISAKCRISLHVLIVKEGNIVKDLATKDQQIAVMLDGIALPKLAILNY